MSRPPRCTPSTHSHDTFLQWRTGMPPLRTRLTNLTPPLDCSLERRSTTRHPRPKDRKLPSAGLAATLMPTAPLRRMVFLPPKL